MECLSKVRLDSNELLIRDLAQNTLCLHLHASPLSLMIDIWYVIRHSYLVPRKACISAILYRMVQPYVSHSTYGYSTVGTST